MKNRIELAHDRSGDPYWGEDNLIDTRASALWAMRLQLEDAQIVADLICGDLQLAPVKLATFSEPSVELVSEVLANPFLLDCVIDATVDAEYHQQSEGFLAVIRFDPVLIDRGENLPLQLLLHELAHHLEWHRLDGFSGHGTEFCEALIQLIDGACDLLGLEPPLLTMEDFEASDPAQRAHLRLAEYRQRFAVWRPCLSPAPERIATTAIPFVVRNQDSSEQLRLF